MRSKELERCAHIAKLRAGLWLTLATAFREGKATRMEMALAEAGHEAAVKDWEEYLAKIEAGWSCIN